MHRAIFFQQRRNSVVVRREHLFASSVQFTVHALVEGIFERTDRHAQARPERTGRPSEAGPRGVELAHWQGVDMNNVLGEAGHAGTVDGDHFEDALGALVRIWRFDRGVTHRIHTILVHWRKCHFEQHVLAIARHDVRQLPPVVCEFTKR